MRLGDQQQWNAGELAKVRITPWQTHVPKVPEVIFKDGCEDDQPQRPDAPNIPRRVYFKKGDFEGPGSHGFTVGCPRCDHARRYGHGQTSKPLNETCRIRIMTELAKTDEGRARIERMGLRADEFLAKRVEEAATGHEAQGEMRAAMQPGGPHDPDNPPPFEPFEQPQQTEGLGGNLRQERAPAEFELPNTANPQRIADEDLPIEPEHPESHEEEPASEYQQEDAGMDVGWVDTKTILDGETEYIRLLLMQDRDEAERTQKDIIATIDLIGGCRQKFRRERRARMKAIVSEIYSAPRVTALARRRRKYGIEPGVALDLTSCDDQGRPWDFNDPEQRQRAEQLLAEQQPEFLIGSPMCTAFSRLQRIGTSIPKGEPGWRDPEKMAEERARAMVHLCVCCQLYLQQMARGGYFVHKHPSPADSWHEECVQEVWSKIGVRRVLCDQCIFGQCNETGEPVKKPTGFLTNSPEVAACVGKRCLGQRGQCSRPGGGEHAPCIGKVASEQPYIMIAYVMLCSKDLLNN